MRQRWIAALLLVGAARLAHADPPKGDAATQLGKLAENFPGVDIQPEGTAVPRVMSFAFGDTENPPADDGPNASPAFIGSLDGKTIGWSADHKAAWVTADVTMIHYCISQGCPSRDPNSIASSVVMVAELGTQWQPLAVSVRVPASDKDALAGDPPPPIAATTEPGAEALATLLASSLADPAALAASVSARKETTLYGSGPGEKVSGGAAVRAKLIKWGSRSPSAMASSPGSPPTSSSAGRSRTSTFARARRRPRSRCRIASR